jgi:hypothetical protein
MKNKEREENAGMNFKFYEDYIKNEEEKHNNI